MQKLNYFALDLDFITDQRIRKLTSDQGGIALSIYILTLSRVYANGYWYRFTDEDADAIAHDLHCKRSCVDESILACFRLGLFTRIERSVQSSSAALLSASCIITSPSIQRRYIQLCNLTGIPPVLKEYKLIDDSFINGRFPPTVDDVAVELSIHNWYGIIDPAEFVKYYADLDWKIKGEPVADWREKVSKWVDRRLHPQHKRHYKQEEKKAAPSKEYVEPKIPPKTEIPEEAKERLRKMGIIR